MKTYNNYSKVFPTPRVGDTLLCSGDGKLSKRIKQMQSLAGYPRKTSKISHIAGICDIPYNLKDQYGCSGLCVIESTTVNPWAGKRGVQVNPLSAWMDNYQGEVWIKYLNFQRNNNLLQKDYEYLSNTIGKPYENGIAGGFELLFCGLGLDRLIKKVWKSYTPSRTIDTIHCSENEACRIKKMGLLKPEVLVNRLPPAMWWEDIDQYYTSDCKVDKIIQIK